MLDLDGNGAWLDDLLQEMVTDSFSSGSNTDTTEEGAAWASDGLEQLARIEARSNEGKKRLHRESMARLRGLQRSRVERLALQNKQLQRRLRLALEIFDGHGRKAGRWSAYVEIVQVGERLLQEQYALEHQLYCWKRYTKLVGVEAERTHEHKEFQAACTPEHVEQDPDCEAWLDNDKLSEASTIAISKGQTLLAQTRCQLGRLEGAAVTTSECFGWQTARSIDVASNTHARLRLCSTRRVLCDGKSPDQVQQRAWEILQYPASSFAWRVVQHVSEDSFLACCTSPAVVGPLHTSCLVLVSRFLAPDTQIATINCVVLDKHQFARVETAPRSHDGLLKHGIASVCFSHSTDPDSIELEFTIAITTESTAHARRFAVEISIALAQWERLLLS